MTTNFYFDWASSVECCRLSVCAEHDVSDNAIATMFSANPTKYPEQTEYSAAVTMYVIPFGDSIMSTK
jgi:hypothetical protein